MKSLTGALAVVLALVVAAPASAGRIGGNEAGGIGFSGGREASHLTLARVGDAIVFTDTAAPLAPGPCAAVDEHTVSCSAGGIRNVGISLGPGDDYFEDDLPAPESDSLPYPVVSIDGEDGDDVIIGGASGELVYYRSGSDTIDGGEGLDELSLSGDSAASVGDTVSLDGVANDGPLGEHGNVTDVEWILGTMLDDTLIGSDGSERLEGNGGDNLLIGGGGPDVLTALGGNDLAYSGSGNDFVFANERGSDDHATIDCGPGHDTVEADAPDTYTSTCEQTPENPFGTGVFPDAQVAVAPASELSEATLGVRVRCDVTAWPCAGKVEVRKARADEHPVIGTAHFTSNSKHAKTVRVRLTRKGRGHLRNARRVVVLVQARDAKRHRARTAREQTVR